MPTLLAVNQNIAVFAHLKWWAFSLIFTLMINMRALNEGELKTRSEIISIGTNLHYEGNWSTRT